MLYNSDNEADYKILDFEIDQNVDIDSWIHKQTLPVVTELDTHTAKHVHMVQLPIVVGLYDDSFNS